MAAAAIFKITQISVNQHGLTELHEIRHADTELVSPAHRPIKVYEF